MAGPAPGIADNELVTGVGLFTVDAMDTEVIRVVEASPVPGIDPPVPKDLFRDSSGIFAKKAGNVRDRHTIVQGLLDIQPVINGQMLMVSRYQS